MGLVAKQFTLHVANSVDTSILMNLSRIAGILDTHRDTWGRPYLRLPDPFADLTLRDDETLGPMKAARLAAAIRHFQERSGNTSGTDGEAQTLGILDKAGVLATPISDQRNRK